MVIVNSDDFTSNALADFGVEVSRTPVTTTFTGNGDEVQTDGTHADITVVLHVRQPQYEQLETGQMQRKDGYVMTAPTQTINKNDKITYNGNTYRVLSVLPRGPTGSIVFYKYCEITLI